MVQVQHKLNSQIIQGHSLSITTTTTTTTNMSPIVARAAIRATTQAQATRQFSVMRTMRNMARSFEPHPFQRLPITNQTQGASWGKQVKRVGSQAAM